MRVALIIILLFVIALPCFAQLTRQDMEQIIQNALEPINKEITAIKLDISEMNKEIIAIKLDIAEMKGKMATKDDIIAVKSDIIATKQNLGDKMDTLYGVLIGVLVAIIVAILSIVFAPFLRRWLEGRGQSVDEKRLQKIEAELEALKGIREAEEKRRETARRIAEENPEFEKAYRAVGLLNDRKRGKTS
ncbi:MAG: hypothetical protein ACE5PV_07275 [Candidatus Poribacteria bacterium]